MAAGPGPGGGGPPRPRRVLPVVDALLDNANGGDESPDEGDPDPAPSCPVLLDAIVGDELELAEVEQALVNQERRKVGPRPRSHTSRTRLKPPSLSAKGAGKGAAPRPRPVGGAGPGPSGAMPSASEVGPAQHGEAKRPRATPVDGRTGWINDRYLWGRGRLVVNRAGTSLDAECRCGATVTRTYNKQRRAKAPHVRAKGRPLGGLTMWLEMECKGNKVHCEATYTQANLPREGRRETRKRATANGGMARAVSAERSPYASENEFDGEPLCLP